MSCNTSTSIDPGYGVLGGSSIWMKSVVSGQQKNSNNEVVVMHSLK